MIKIRAFTLILHEITLRVIREKPYDWRQKRLIDIWLESEFQGGRSLPKVQMIYAMDDAKRQE